jgi:hypothetical protein
MASRKPFIINNTQDSTSSSSGSLIVRGGVAIRNSTDSVSNTNGGALTIAGGAAIGKSLYVGSNIHLSGQLFNNLGEPFNNESVSSQWTGNVGDTIEYTSGGVLVDSLTTGSLSITSSVKSSNDFPIVDRFQSLPDYFQNAVTQKELVIAHRFGHLCQPTFSMKSIVRQIEKGVRFVEVDLATTSNGVFYVTHFNSSTAEEYDSADLPNQVTDISLKDAFIMRGNPSTRFPESLPTLEEFWDVIKKYNVVVVIELKGGSAASLVTKMKSIGMGPSRVLFADGEKADTLLMKQAGFTVAFDIRSDTTNWTDLTQGEKDSFDFIVCSKAIASQVQAFNKPFIIFTLLSPAEWENFRSQYSNLVGCFTDVALPTIHYKNKKSDDRFLTLLDPENGFVAHLQATSAEKLDRAWLEFKYPTVRLNCHKAVTARGRTAFQFHTYKLPNTFYGKVNISEGNTSGWMGFSVRCGSDYRETDVGGDGEIGLRQAAINVIMRRSGSIELHELSNGNFFSRATSTGHSALQTAEVFWGFTRQVTSGVATAFLKLSTKPSEVLNPTVSPTVTYAYSTNATLASSDIYLTMMSRPNDASTAMTAFLEFSPYPYPDPRYLEIGSSTQSIALRSHPTNVEEPWLSLSSGTTGNTHTTAFFNRRQDRTFGIFNIEASRAHYRYVINPTTIANDRLALLEGGGNVGIGTVTPTSKLDIHNGDLTLTYTKNINVDTIGKTFPYKNMISTGFNVGDQVYFYTPGTANGNIQFSISSDGYIRYRVGHTTISDTRIKKDILDIDDDSALNMLRQIEPKTYTYIEDDRTNSRVYGFLAQQVAQVIPHAVKTSDEAVPNVYKAHAFQYNGDDATATITIENCPFQMQEGYTTRLQISKLSTKTSYKLFEVESIDGNQVKIKNVSESSKDELHEFAEEISVFVYGSTVPDFQSLNKEVLFTIATAALQEVDRQVQADKARISSLELEVGMLLQRLDALENAN